MTNSHHNNNPQSNNRHSGKQTLWNWLFTVAILVGIAGLVTTCSSEVENKSQGSQKVGITDQLASPTFLPPISLTEEKSALTQVKDNIPVSTFPPIVIPSITPIPTVPATIQPTATPIPSDPVVTQLPVALTMTPAAIKSPPLPTPVDVYSWTLKVPILMYHYISTPPDDADKYRTDLSVTPENFRKQMAYLADNGFETIDLYDLSLAITNKRELPPKPVIITLDDGYRDNYENAFPVLQEHGLKATFFVVTDFIDHNVRDYMSWDMVEEMSAAGMRIEPHSKTHADLTAREREDIVYEVLGSTETIAAHIGERPRFFCYPGGRYNETTLEVVAELDFWGAVTTASGDWHSYR